MKKLSQLIKKEISAEDILKIAGKPFKLMEYQDLQKYNNIDDVFGKSKYVVILYEYEKNDGHFVLLIKQDKNRIEYFDSIYCFPDFILTQLPFGIKHQFHEDNFKLSKLLKKSQYQIDTNSKVLQKGDSETCGRFVGLRIRFSDIPLYEFIDFFTNSKYMTADQLATSMSFYVAHI